MIDTRQKIVRKKCIGFVSEVSFLVSSSIATGFYPETTRKKLDLRSVTSVALYKGAGLKMEKVAEEGPRFGHNLEDLRRKHIT